MAAIIPRRPSVIDKLTAFPLKKIRYIRLVLAKIKALPNLEVYNIRKVEIYISVLAYYKLQ